MDIRVVVDAAQLQDDTHDLNIRKGGPWFTADMFGHNTHSLTMEVHHGRQHLQSHRIGGNER